LSRPARDVEYWMNALRRHLAVKQVAHRVDEHYPSYIRANWELGRLLVRRRPDAGATGGLIAISLVLRLSHFLETLREHGRITMVAASRRTSATLRRIPRCTDQFDAASIGHLTSLVVRRASPGQLSISLARHMPGSKRSIGAFGFGTSNANMRRKCPATRPVGRVLSDSNPTRVVETSSEARPLSDEGSE